jgi:hypothetical protein
MIFCVISTVFFCKLNNSEEQKIVENCTNRKSKIIVNHL